MSATPQPIGRQFFRVVRRARNATWVKLKGVLDETFLKDKLAEGLKGVIVFDLSEVQRITSYGVREWTAALAQLGVDSYYFVGCSPTVVSQFNMVADFAGKGTLVSFKAPYRCSSCSREFEIDVDLRTQHAQIAAFEAPDKPCPHCGAAGSFDDLPEVYFYYAAERPAPQVDAALDPVISGKPEAFVLPLRVEKKVKKNTTFLLLAGSSSTPTRFSRIADGVEGTAIVSFEGVTGDVLPLVPLLESLAGNPTSGAIVAWALPVGALPIVLRHPQLGTRVQIASLTVTRECPACHVAASDRIDGPLPAGKVPGAVAEKCGACGAPITTSFEGDVVAALNDVELVALPSGIEVADFAPGAVSTPEVVKGGRFGKYELLERIGSGGMAELFLGRLVGPQGFQKTVAVKQILPQLSSAADFIEMFLREARLAAQISHPNVVQIFDLGEHQGQYYIAMEYVRGWDLSTLIKCARELNQIFPLGFACRVTMDVCAGLHAAHTATNPEGEPLGIVHRDVSPHNVLVGVNGSVKVTDFGIAKAHNSRTGSTQPGTIKGKLSFIAPELLSDEHAVASPRTDVFALGVILYELVTQKALFRRETEMAAMHAILHAPIQPASSLRPEVPLELDRVIDKALAREPERRFQSAQEFRVELERVLPKLPAEPTTDLGEWAMALMRQARPWGIGGTASFMTPSRSSTGDQPTATGSPKSTSTVLPGSSDPSTEGTRKN